jgi:hypothetical protein
MAIYEGKVRIRLHPKKGVMLDKGVDGSSLTAADASSILTTMIEAATKHKTGIDRWSLYIPELALTMSKDAVQITPAKIKPYMDGSREAVMTSTKYGTPRLLYVSPEKSMRKSAIIDIA